VAVMLVKSVLLVPLAGLAYEVNRWSATRLHRSWVRARMAPGF